MWWKRNDDTLNWIKVNEKREEKKNQIKACQRCGNHNRNFLFCLSIHMCIFDRCYVLTSSIRHRVAQHSVMNTLSTFTKATTNIKFQHHATVEHEKQSPSSLNVNEHILWLIIKPNGFAFTLTLPQRDCDT